MKMKTVSRLGMIAVIVVWVVAAPARAQSVANQEMSVGVVGQGVPHNPYTPPPCVAGVPFADVTCSTFYDAWIEQFAADGITAGCGNGDYCPNENVTRAQMAVFIEAAMHGTANWSPGDLGNQNTGLGAAALLNNSPYAIGNTAVGYQALNAQSFANGNALYFAYNTAIGEWALNNNQPDGGNGGINGTQNTALGEQAGAANTTGFDNTMLGAYAGGNNQTGWGNTFVGDGAAPENTGLIDATAIGFSALVDASYHVRVGDDNVTQIGGKVGWSNLSDIRAKTNVVPLDRGLDLVMALRPVSFQLISGNGRTDMGFIAQDVEALLGDGYNVLGIGGDAARTLSLRYTDFIAPVVKAIQEQEAQIESQKADIAARDTRIQNLEADVAALKTEVQALLAAQSEGPAKTPR
jgi:hypothetical protein